MSVDTLLDPDAWVADVEEDVELPAAPGVAAMGRVTEQLSMDADLDAGDLVEVLAHSHATVAAARFRMMQVASLIHDKRAEEYQEHVAETMAGHPEVGERSAEEMAQIVERGHSGDRQAGARELFGPDGMEQAIADVGAVLCIPPSRARALIESGHAARYLLPATAVALSVGRIDLRRFEIAMRRTELVDNHLMEQVDCRIALAIADRDQMSITRFTAMVDSIVAAVDPRAIKRRRERAETDRDVQVRPDRFAPGQSRMSAQLPSLDGAAVDARLDALAAAVHAADPRTKPQRRADALVALAAGADGLACRCEQCLALPDTNDTNDTNDDASNDSGGPDVAEDAVADSDDDAPDAPGDSDCDGRTETPTPAPAEEAPTPAPTPTTPTAVIHVVINQSTLEGADDDPGFLDGHGVIDAESARELARSPFTRIVGVDPHRIADGLAGMRYRPGTRLQAFIRTGELCCTFPGCDAPVSTSDLDHTEPFDHDHPERGGPTARWNLKPLCRFHHRLKTFTHWRDHQDPLGTVVFESPSGHLFFGNAFRGIDLFPALRPHPPGHPARIEIESRHNARRDAHRRADKRRAAADPPPF